MTAIEESDPAIVELMRNTAGFFPNSYRVMARNPELTRAMRELALVVVYSGKVDIALKWLVGHVASRAAGCRYCSAHTANGVAKRSKPTQPRSTQSGISSAVRSSMARSALLCPSPLPLGQHQMCRRQHISKRCGSTSATMRYWKLSPSSRSTVSGTDGTTHWSLPLKINPSHLASSIYRGRAGIPENTANRGKRSPLGRNAEREI